MDIILRLFSFGDRGLCPINRAKRLNLCNKSERPNFITANRVFEKKWVNYVALTRFWGLVAEICLLMCADLVRYMYNVHYISTESLVSYPLALNVLLHQLIYYRQYAGLCGATLYMYIHVQVSSEQFLLVQLSLTHLLRGGRVHPTWHLHRLSHQT